MLFLVYETCYGLGTGDIRIDLEVSNCEGMASGDAHSGMTLLAPSL